METLHENIQDAKEAINSMPTDKMIDLIYCHSSRLYILSNEPYLNDRNRVRIASGTVNQVFDFITNHTQYIESYKL